MSVIRILRKFENILSFHQKIRIFELVILMIIGGFLETCTVSLMLPFMNVVMDPDETLKQRYIAIICDSLNIDSAKTFLVLVAICLAVVYILKNIYLMFEFNIQYRFVYGNMFAMQRKVLDIFVHRPYEYFLKINSGEVMRIINGDIADSFSMLITLLNFFTELAVSSMLIITIFIINPIATLCVAILMGGMLVAINYAIKPIIRAAGVDNQRASTGMNKWLLQSIQGIKELKVMRKEEFFKENYDKYGQIFVQTNRKNQMYNMLPRFLIEAVSMSSMFIIMAVMIYQGINLETIIPILTAVAMAAIRLLPSINRISSAMAMMAYNESRLDKMIESLQELDDSKTEPLIQPFIREQYMYDGKVPNLSQKIEFTQITYRYPGSNSNVLENASMVINKGESVGVIGPSGAGKTTAIDIILGLLFPQEGQVLADGIDIHKNIKDWLAQVGYIPQMIFMLDDTIKSNVAFGEAEELISEEHVWKALKEASLDEFVRTLPEGLNTEIGERGVRLSGGQRQRIGIARALYRNPSILIFDEATSALDNETESAIMESVNDLRGQKTMIIIAHRLTTIEACEHIFKIENGKITKER